MLGARSLVAAVAGVLALGVAGCAKQMAVPNLPASTVPPASSTAPPPATAPPTVTAPARPAPPPPVAAPAVPPVKPPPVLSPQMGAAEEGRLSSEALARIEGAESVVRQIDQQRLAPPQLETFSTVQSFLVKAREAMTAKDYPRALTLADKARVLAAELSQSLR